MLIWISFFADLMIGSQWRFQVLVHFSMPTWTRLRGIHQREISNLDSKMSIRVQSSRLILPARKQFKVNMNENLRKLCICHSIFRYKKCIFKWKNELWYNHQILWQFTRLLQQLKCVIKGSFCRYIRLRDDEK